MRRLRVWLIALLCSVLAMPLQASTALHTSQEILQQAVSTTAGIPVSLFIQERTISQPEVILEQDKALVAACFALVGKLNFPATYFKPLTPGVLPAHNRNGLHTIFIAGP